MALSRARVRALYRRRYIAHRLIEGPRSFWPPRRHGYGWLEPTLRLTVGDWPGSREARSAALFCDDSMNKTGPLFTPMIRIASWQCGAEYENSGGWPLVSVRWGFLRRGYKRVDTYLRRLTRAMQDLSVVGGGIYVRTKRSAAKLVEPYEEFSVMMRTEDQRVEFWSPAFVGDRLPKLLLLGYEVLDDVMVPARIHRWKETFNDDLTSKRLLRRDWDWDGKRPK